MMAMPTVRNWRHAKHDNLLPRFSGYGEQELQLPLPDAHVRPKSVVQAAFDGEKWWCNGHIYTLQDGSLRDLLGARVVVNTLYERQQLMHALGETLDCVVLDEWFDDVATNGTLAAQVKQLQLRMEHCQNQLRVDFSRHASMLSAWKWRNLRRIHRQWPVELQSTHRWLQSVDDRPWQEARMAYDLREMAGAVLDIRSAYASAVEKMLFPTPGEPWIVLRAGERHMHAMHCVVWEPTDAQGRFFHPFWYNAQGVRGLPGYGLEDRVHQWVLDEDLAWLQRHGVVHGVYQSVAPASMEHHPLSASVVAWKELLAKETEPGYRRAHKMRLVSSHSWTWQPHATTLIADEHALTVHALQEYSSRPAARIGGLRVHEDHELGLVAQGHAGHDNGWYTPIAWIRLKLRSHLMRRVEHALAHGLEIAYVSVDGFHARAPDIQTIQVCHDTFVDPLAPWWSWRIDKTFAKGIWFRPGSYALQNEDGQWVCTNLPAVVTGKDWNLWCQARGTLDARKNVGYWRRPNKPHLWEQHMSIALHAQRLFRNVVRAHLHR